MAGGSTKAVVAAMVANAGIAIAKFVAFLFTGASSMLAESIHSVADTGNQGLLLFGAARARRSATPEHPFGYGRTRYFWAFIVAMVLFLLGGLFSLFEGYEKLRDPHEIESLGWAIGVLGFGIVIEGYSFSVAIREANAVRGKRSWWGFIRHSKQPELPVVLLEDAGAMFGLVIAMVAVLLAFFTGEPVWDAIGTLVIGALLVVIAIVLAIEMKGLLIGEAAGASDLDRIQRALVDGGEVRRIVHMRTQHLGPDELLVGAKLEFDPGLSGADLAEAVDRVEGRVREVVPIARVIYLEPAVAA